MNRLIFAAPLLAACSTDTFVTPDSGGTDAPNSDSGCVATPQACAPNAACLSFDTTVSYAPFTDLSHDPGGVKIASDDFVTCPHSLLATLNAVTVAGTGRAAIGASTTVSIVTGRAHIEADVFLPTNPVPASYLALQANGDNQSAVSVAYASGGWVLSVAASGQTQSLQPRVGAWNHLILDVQFSDNNSVGSATLVWDEQSGSKQTTKINDSTLPGGTTTVSQISGIVGIVPMDTTSATVTAYYDDVVFSTL